MNAEIKFEVTDGLLSRSARKVALRHRWYLLPVYAVVGGVLGSRIGSGGTCWTLGVGALFLAVGLLMRVVWYVRLRRSSLRFWREVRDRSVTCRITDEGFRLTTVHSDATLPWRMFERLRPFRDVWLLYAKGRGYTPIPADMLGQDVRDFLKQKIREHGGKVK